VNGYEYPISNKEYPTEEGKSKKEKKKKNGFPLSRE